MANSLIVVAALLGTVVAAVFLNDYLQSREQKKRLLGLLSEMEWELFLVSQVGKGGFEQSERG